MPVLHGTLGVIFCTKREALEMGDHMVWFGNVVSVQEVSPAAVSIAMYNVPVAIQLSLCHPNSREHRETHCCIMRGPTGMWAKKPSWPSLSRQSSRSTSV
jgi:hypothetical protein